MKKIKYLLLFSLMLIPNVVFASSGNSDFPIGVTPAIAVVVDLFVGGFIIVFIIVAIIKTPLNKMYNQVTNAKVNNDLGNLAAATSGETGVVLKCAKCGGELSATDKFCQNCGTAFVGNNVQVVQDTSPIVLPDPSYLVNEKIILTNIIKEEINLQGEDISKFTTRSLNKKRNILLGIFGVCTLFVAILYFFNTSLIKCFLFEGIALIIFKIISENFTVLKTLTKQAIKSPDSDISKLVNDARTEKQEEALPDILKLAIVAFVAIILPTIVFFNPKVLYKNYDGGYQVFRYTRGITYNEEVTIPSTYKGKSVISIGDNAFKNSSVKRVNLPNGLETIKAEAFSGCKNIEEIIIPSSVTEIRAEAFANCNKLTTVSLSEGLLTIRGNAFANDRNLVNIKLPSTLEYLGGGAFSHCSSLVEMTIPKGVTEINGQTFEYCTSLRKINLHNDIISIHGEVFIGDSSLNNVVLPSKITEIRGNTFENCTSLTSIVIPKGVTRIGGYAFYGCSSLSYVSVPSTVNEIGSSAFRQCYSLRNIRIPYNALVNEKAFKESPTYIERYA